jgi:hypothetical protein
MQFKWIDCIVFSNLMLIDMAQVIPRKCQRVAEVGLTTSTCIIGLCFRSLNIQRYLFRSCETCEESILAYQIFGASDMLLSPGSALRQ